MLLVRVVAEFERQNISVLNTGKVFLAEKIFNGLENVSPFTRHDKLFKSYILSIGSHNSNASSLSIPTIYWYRIPSEATSDKYNCEITEELSASINNTLYLLFSVYHTLLLYICLYYQYNIDSILV